MRIVFAGSPAIAIPALEAVFAMAAVSGRDEDIELAAVLTNPDSPRGRSGKLEPTELGAAAQRLAIPALKALKLDSGARDQIAALKPDLLLSFAYGRIFGPKMLGLFPLGGINIHPSLLPKYRGPAPIPAAILNRDSETGLTIQRLALEMDCGDILAQERLTLSGRETTAGLSETMAHKAAEMLPAVLRGLASGALRGKAQNHAEASYCSLLAKEDGRILWAKIAAEIDARIRAFTPWPLCWTMHGDQQLFILKAAPLEKAPLEKAPAAGEAGRVLGIDKQQGILIQTGQGALAVSELQYRAKKALDWKAFLNGARDFLGAALG